MTTDMKYFDKYYVGLDRKRTTASGQPLAFAVPDGNDSGAKKRKATVDAWALGYYSAYDTKGRLRKDIKSVGKVYDNYPMTGFRLTEWSGRYITDNKVVRVLDPRGFELEIYIPNLMDIILNYEVDHGLIKDELVWLREGANNRLVRTSDPAFAQAKKNTVVAEQKRKKPIKIDHVPGDIISNTWGDWLYMGLLDVEYVIPRGERVLDKEMTRQAGTARRPKSFGMFWSANPDDYIEEVVREFFKLQDDVLEGVNVGRRHVYKRVSLDPRDMQYVNGDHEITFRKSKMTAQKVASSGNLVPKTGAEAYFQVDYDSMMYYDEAGKLYTPREFEDLEESANKGVQWPDQRVYLEGKTMWKTVMARVSDGALDAAPVKGRFNEKLLRGIQY